jgi:hypothetical protein
MQRFTLTAAVTVLLTATISSALAQIPISKEKTVIHSAAYPNRVKVTRATYHIGIQVGRVPLSGIRVEVPENAPAQIRFGQVAVTDSNGNPITANTSSNEKGVTIAFTSPVAAGETIEIDLLNVKTSDLTGRTWLFPVYGKTAESDQELPLGTARIQTYQ